MRHFFSFINPPHRNMFTRNEKVLLRLLCPHYFLHSSTGPLPAGKPHTSLPRNDWQQTLSARLVWANWHSQAKFDNYSEPGKALLIFWVAPLTFMFVYILRALDFRRKEVHLQNTVFPKASIWYLVLLNS